jgi:hypothetical protein
MPITAALTLVILIAMGIGTLTLVIALRPNSKIEPETLSRVMSAVIVTGLSATAALVVTVILNR